MKPRDRVREAPRSPLSPELAHDLRTPLNQVIGYSEMLIEQAEEGGHDSLLDDLRKVHGAGRQLLALIDESAAAGIVEAPAASGRERRARTRAGGSPAEELPTRSAEAGGSRGFLLVVDDLEANREVLSRRLELQGYRVATAENGREAMGMLRDDVFELVLLDIMMPEMDGYEVLRLLKADERLRRIPVIMISALSEMESVARCIELGAEDYLPKPFNPVLLKARVGASLEKKRVRDREVALHEQLRQSYDRLQELEKLRDDLTSMIVHDLRAPLTAVIGGMQTLELLGELNERQRRMMNISIAGGETLLGMINDLLDVEKLEAGAMRLDLVVLSATDLAASAVGQVATLAASRGLTIHGEIIPGLPLLTGDEGKLRRVLVNLLGNAIKFTPAGGTVTLDAGPSPDERALVFSVRDTGEGIPAEAFVRIFEKFGQVESREGGRVASTGLGLAFCRLAVEAHGGGIEVESTLGEGSTFRFSIPLPAPLG